jgi:hypothetical protein
VKSLLKHLTGLWSGIHERSRARTVTARDETCCCGAKATGVKGHGGLRDDGGGL